MLALLITLLSAPTSAPPAPPVAPPSAAPASSILHSAPPDGGVIVVGSIERAVVEQVVKAGPQPFIAGVQVAPAMEGGKFNGFRLMGFLATSPLAGSENIRAGDIIVSVNGLALERPDQFMRAWGALAKAERLEVKLLRGEQPLTYRWTIQP